MEEKKVISHFIAALVIAAVLIVYTFVRFNLQMANKSWFIVFIISVYCDRTYMYLLIYTEKQ